MKIKVTRIAVYDEQQSTDKCLGEVGEVRKQSKKTYLAYFPKLNMMQYVDKKCCEEVEA